MDIHFGRIHSHSLSTTLHSENPTLSPFVSLSSDWHLTIIIINHSPCACSHKRFPIESHLLSSFPGSHLSGIARQVHITQNYAHPIHLQIKHIRSTPEEIILTVPVQSLLYCTQWIKSQPQRNRGGKFIHSVLSSGALFNYHKDCCLSDLLLERVTRNQPLFKCNHAPSFIVPRHTTISCCVCYKLDNNLLTVVLATVHNNFRLFNWKITNFITIELKNPQIRKHLFIRFKFPVCGLPSHWFLEIMSNNNSFLEGYN